jgi:hypothetical protein
VFYIPTQNRPNVVNRPQTSLNAAGNQLRFIDTSDIFWEWTAMEKSNVMEKEPEFFVKKISSFDRRQVVSSGEVLNAETYMKRLKKKWEETKQAFSNVPPRGFLQGLEGLTMKYRILKNVVEEVKAKHDRFSKHETIPSKYLHYSSYIHPFLTQ